MDSFQLFIVGGKKRALLYKIISNTNDDNYF